MNSTSARDGGSNVALVEDGSVLLGFPGAPGWTTTGASAGEVCCARAGINNELAMKLAVNSVRTCATAFLERLCLRWRGGRWNCNLDTKPGIFNALPYHEAQGKSKRASEFGCGNAGSILDFFIHCAVLTCNTPA
jgi:hypothetical protein